MSSPLVSGTLFLNALREKLDKLSRKPNTLLKELESMINSCYKIIDYNTSRKATYSVDDVLNMIAKIKVYGETKHNSGGRAPKPDLVVVLKGETYIDVGIERDINACISDHIYNLGFSEKTLFEQSIDYLKELEETVEVLKIQYSR